MPPPAASPPEWYTSDVNGLLQALFCAGRHQVSSWQFDDPEPKVLTRADDSKVLVEIVGFANVAIGMQRICLPDVGLGLGCSQDHNWDRPKRRICFDTRQHLAPVATRQIQIEKDQIGPFGVGVWVFSSQETERSVTVTDYE
jgi:hypothetical protein